ncbi:hypothetical protein ACFL3T_04445 [Patescibacteria group bacterium]
MAKLSNDQLAKLINTMRVQDVLQVAKIKHLSQRIINILVNHQSPLVKIALMNSNTLHTKELIKLSKDKDKKVAENAKRLLTEREKETQKYVDSLNEDLDY